MELVLINFWFLQLFNGIFFHFQRFLDEYRQCDNTVILIYGPWIGVWMLRFYVALDFISGNWSKWKPSILLIFFPVVGIWVYRGIITLRYLAWANIDLGIEIRIYSFFCRGIEVFTSKMSSL